MAGLCFDTSPPEPKTLLTMAPRHTQMFVSWAQAPPQLGALRVGTETLCLLRTWKPHDKWHWTSRAPEQQEGKDTGMISFTWGQPCFWLRCTWKITHFRLGEARYSFLVVDNGLWKPEGIFKIISQAQVLLTWQSRTGPGLAWWKGVQSPEKGAGRKFCHCSNMYKPGRHYVKWNEPGTERQMPGDLTYLWNLKKMKS